MKFFKDNSYDIVKLYINQIGIAIFSLVLYTAIGFVDDTSLSLKIRIVMSALATLFYFALLYTVAWEYGAKDKIRIDSGKAKRIPAKGVWLSLAANIPNFILTVPAIISVAIYLGTGIEGFATAFAVFNLLMRFVLSMYLGMIQGVFAPFELETYTSYYLQSFGYLLLPLVAVFVTHIGYSFGEKNFRISSLFSSKDKAQK